MVKKPIALIIAALLCFSLFTGCGSSDSSDSSTGSTSAVTGSGSNQSETSSEDIGTGIYPIKTDATLSIWTNYYPLDTSFTEESQSPFHIGLSKNTGVNIKWLRATAGTDFNQAYNLMIASGDLPDIIFTDEINVKATTLIPDGYIVTLNDYIQDYAPALKTYLDKNPQYLRAIKSDSGDMYAFPWLRSTDFLRTWMGPLLRKDLLVKVGKAVPETIDDWTALLYALKNEVEIPLGSRGPSTICDFTKNAYGIELGYYLDGDQVKFGFAEPGFKDLMILTNKWYKDGLIDRDYATMNPAGLQTKVLNDQIGSCYSAAAALFNYMAGLAPLGSKSEWVAAPYPVLKKGNEITIIHGENYWSGLGAVITTACKDVKLACRFLDYGYTDQGAIYMNFGTEGVSFEYKDGVPTFTDLIMKAPEGVTSAMAKYLATGAGGVTYHIQGMYEQRAGELGSNAIGIWTKGVDAQKAKIPPMTSTTAESTATSSIEAAIGTYAWEMYNKFIMGEEDIANYQKFVDNLYSMGLGEALKIRNLQLKRYNSR